MTERVMEVLERATLHCTRCDQDKPENDFGQDVTKFTGRMSQCRDCANASRRDRYTENLEHEHARSRAYYAANRVRIAARNQADRDQARAIYGGACTGCGTDTDLEFHHPDGDGIEHRQSESMQRMCTRIARRGSQLTDRRLVLLCLRCHHDAHPGMRSYRGRWVRQLAGQR